MRKEIPDYSQQEPQADPSFGSNLLESETISQATHPVTETLAHLGDLDFRRRVAENAADAAVEELYSRDALAGLDSRENSLRAYDASGNFINPAEEQYEKVIRQEAKQLCRDAIGSMSHPEAASFVMLFPKLVRALSLDRRYLTATHDKAIKDVFTTALTMFQHPEQIKRNHIRQGEGGSENLNGRGPSYMISALETMKRVNTVFTTHGNWAMHHELHDIVTANEGPAHLWIQTQKQMHGIKYKGSGIEYSPGDYVNEWVANQLQSATKSKRQLSSEQWLKEIDEPKHMDPILVKHVLEASWQKITGGSVNMADLQHKYHFTYDKPTLVIFNATHAAINIDRMHPERALATRDVSQRFKKAFIERYYPTLSDSVVFQNDLPWSEHTTQTKLKVRYLYDLMQKQNGDREEKDQTLANYGDHHKAANDYGPIDGIPPHIYYAILHAAFFADKSQAKEGAEKFYIDRIMEETDTEGNVQMQDALTLTFHQGRPELTFGYYRKKIAEFANMRDYDAWLEQRQNAIIYDYATMARTITERALVTMKKATGWNGRDFQAYLTQADREIPKAVRDDFFKDYIQAPAMGGEKSEEGDSPQEEVRKLLASNKKQAAFWGQFLEQLEAQKPKDEEEKAAMLEVLAQEREHVQQRLESLRALKRKFDDSLQREDHEQTRMYAASTDMQQQMFPFAQTEWLTAGMKKPAYYEVAEVDSQTYPDLQPVALSKYDARIAELRKTFKRLKGTTAVVVKRSTALAVGLGIQLDEEAPELSQDVIASIEAIIEEADRLETTGDAEKVIPFIEHSLKSVVDTRFLASQGIHTKPETGLVLAKAAKRIQDTLLSDINSQAVQVESVRDDYLLVLSAINPKLVAIIETGKIPKSLGAEVQKAEAEYNAFLEEFFGTNTPTPEPTPEKEEYDIFVPVAA